MSAKAKFLKTRLHSSLCLALLICGGSLTLGQAAYAENLIGNQAVLRALDKVTATTEDFTVPVGDVLQYGSLNIQVRHCEKRPPEETPETYVFLQIENQDQSVAISEASSFGTKTDKNLDGEGQYGDKLFSGWMFASSPALSSLEHAVYDIWAIDCIVPVPVVPDLLDNQLRPAGNADLKTIP